MKIVKSTNSVIRDMFWTYLSNNSVKDRSCAFVFKSSNAVVAGIYDDFMVRPTLGIIRLVFLVLTVLVCIVYVSVHLLIFPSFSAVSAFFNELNVFSVSFLIGLMECNSGDQSLESYG